MIINNYIELKLFTFQFVVSLFGLLIRNFHVEILDLQLREKKILWKICTFAGVQDVKADILANKLTVTGKVDAGKLQEKLVERTKKKVELLTPQPKKEAAATEKPAEKKPEEKKSDDKKPDDKKPEDKKPKEVNILIHFHAYILFEC